MSNDEPEMTSMQEIAVHFKGLSKTSQNFSDTPSSDRDSMPSEYKNVDINNRYGNMFTKPPKCLCELLIITYI